MSTNELCWCGKPIQKSETESSLTEVVYRCSQGHRLSRQSGLRQAAGLASLVTLGIFLGSDIPDVGGNS